MEIITVSATAAATVSFTPAEDSLVVAYQTSGQFMLSTDPSATYANRITTPIGNQVDHGILICAAGTGTWGVAKIPIFRIEVYYVAFKGAGVAVFFLEPVTQP